MEKQISVAKHENSILPGFRNKISKAESAEDVKNFFVYTVRELLVNVFQDNKYHDFDAIQLSVSGDPLYTLDDSRVTAEAFGDEFFNIWNNSDLPRVVAGLAETATHRRRHLGKKPEKTTAKIRN
ncbi:MAG: hypothetical protein C4518_03385 [Desulfobacteraceae bacterium]|nr:MAG: hypothetical protein C4518_03385 [Desulfobacteraceae bacterium]